MHHLLYVLVLMSTLALAACQSEEAVEVAEMSEAPDWLVPPGAVPRNDPTLDGFTVPDMSKAELNAWYTENMPDRKPFAGWAWCETFDVAGDTVTRVFRKPGTQDFLLVTIGPNDQGSSVIFTQTREFYHPDPVPDSC